VVTEEQSYGPRWLRVNDDDDDPKKNKNYKNNIMSSNMRSGPDRKI